MLFSRKNHSSRLTSSRVCRWIPSDMPSGGNFSTTWLFFHEFERCFSNFFTFAAAFKNLDLVKWKTWQSCISSFIQRIFFSIEMQATNAWFHFKKFITLKIKFSCEIASSQYFTSEHTKRLPETIVRLIKMPSNWFSCFVFFIFSFQRETWQRLLECFQEIVFCRSDLINCSLVGNEIWHEEKCVEHEFSFFRLCWLSGP